MEQIKDDNVLSRKFFRAIQKNKIIQNQLADRQHLCDIQLVKDMKNYNSQEKYNQELLYAWKKECYIRQLKKNIQEYQRNTSDVDNAYYQYQIKNLDHIINGRSGLINAKYQQFLQEHPLKTSKIPVVRNQIEQGEDENTRSLEKTWKYIHAQSASRSRRKRSIDLPIIDRSSTIDEIRINKVLTRNVIPSASNELGRTDSQVVGSSSDEKLQRLSTKHRSKRLESSDRIEPLLMLSETFDNHNRTDLVRIRSIRRPRLNVSDLNYLYESRKRFYQMNRRVFNY
jgi:hypothetical protein